MSEHGVYWDRNFLRIQARADKAESEVERLKKWREVGLDVLAATDDNTLHDALIRLRRLKEGE